MNHVAKKLTDRILAKMPTSRLGLNAPVENRPASWSKYRSLVDYGSSCFPERSNGPAQLVHRSRVSALRGVETR